MAALSNRLLSPLGAGLLLAAFSSTIVMAGPPVIPDPAVRLVLAGGTPQDGAFLAGVEIRLPPEWHTYWRNPGDSGIPPSFDTAGSTNLATFKVLYPAPDRYFDGYSTSIVYHAGVLLPVQVTPVDPAKPVDLKLRMDFGFCHEICVPGSATLEGVLDPAAAHDDDEAALIEEAAARVPALEATAPVGVPRLTAIEATADALLLTVETDEDAGGIDLFAEPPEGWYLAVPEETSSVPRKTVFRLPLAGKPKTASLSGATFRFTLTGGAGAVEVVRTLP